MTPVKGWRYCDIGRQSDFTCDHAAWDAKALIVVAAGPAHSKLVDQMRADDVVISAGQAPVVLREQDSRHPEPIR